MSANAVAFLAAAFALIGTAFTAYLAHKGNTQVRVDPRVLQFLQNQMDQLEQSQERLRSRLAAEEKESDEQRMKVRALLNEVARQQDLLRRIRLALEAAGVAIPPAVESLFSSNGGTDGLPQV
jgi:hypothetical protein